MVARDSLGAKGAPFRLDVERGKIQEFAEAIRCDHPAYFERDDPVCPPTFLTTSFFWEKRSPGSNPWEKVQMDQKRGMHAEQEYVFFGPPPRAGTRLTCQSRIDEIYEKQGRQGGTMTFVVMVTEFRDPYGKLVAEGRLTGVETSKAPEEG
jgi:hypothetical protein